MRCVGWRLSCRRLNLIPPFPSFPPSLIFQLDLRRKYEKISPEEVRSPLIASLIREDLARGGAISLDCLPHPRRSRRRRCASAGRRVLGRSNRLQLPLSSPLIASHLPLMVSLIRRASAGRRRMRALCMIRAAGGSLDSKCSPARRCRCCRSSRVSSRSMQAT